MMTDDERRLLLMAARTIADLYESTSRADTENRTVQVVLDLRNLAHIVESNTGEHSSPHEEGVDAFHAGKDLLANPYLENGSPNHEWMTGWQDAEKR